MRKKIVRVLFLSAIVLAWLAAFLFQRLACFDVFETNAPHRYVLACGFAMVQYAILGFEAGQRHPSWLFIGHSVLYGICAFFAAKVIFTAHRYNPMPLGLFVCSLILDLSGLLLCFFLVVYKRRYA